MSGETTTGGRLDEVNAAFHGAYDGARDAAEDRGPVLIAYGDFLILRRGEERLERRILSRGYHRIRSAAHAPVAVYLARVGAGAEAARARLPALLASVRASEGEVSDEADLAPAAAADAKAVLEATRRCLEAAISPEGASREAMDAFARGLGPRLLRLADHATAMELAALHRETNALLGLLGSAESDRLHVVVAGAHQARERSLALQYFKQRFEEPEGEEHRVAFAENAATEEVAVGLVGTQRLDRLLAKAFFGDEKRLQRDVLGDAAQSQLEHFDWNR